MEYVSVRYRFFFKIKYFRFLFGHNKENERLLSRKNVGLTLLERNATSYMFDIFLCSSFFDAVSKTLEFIRLHKINNGFIT
jgi:hypothetical protein